MESKRYIEFIASTFGNDQGDFVEIEYEDDTDIYYTDGFDRPCYLPKDTEGLVFEYIDAKYVETEED